MEFLALTRFSVHIWKPVEEVLVEGRLQPVAVRVLTAVAVAVEMAIPEA